MKNPWAEYDAWEQRPACPSHPPGCPDAPGEGYPSPGATGAATGALGGLAVVLDEAMPPGYVAIGGGEDEELRIFKID
jgi:hypothetical protein